MKGIKRALALLLTLVMILSLAGCQWNNPSDNNKTDGGKKQPGNKKELVQQLLSHVEPIDFDKYYNVGVVMDISSDSEGSQYHMFMDAKMEGSADVAHIYDTTLSVTADGYDFDFVLETWDDYAGRLSYSNVEFMGESTGWVYTSTSDMDTELTVSIQDMVDRFSGFSDTEGNMTLQPREDGEDYVLTWEASPEELSEAISGAQTWGGAGSESFDYTLLSNVSAIAVFSPSDEVLKSITVSGSGDVFSLEVTVTFIDINGNPNKTLTIPEDIVLYAIGDGVASDGDWPATDLYENDGEGYDELLDGMMVPCIQDREPNTFLYVRHYDKVNTLYWECEGDDWYGDLDIVRAVPEPSYEVLNDFKMEYQLDLDALGEDALYSGSVDEGKVTFLYTDDYGDTHAIYMECLSDYFVQIHVRRYNGDTPEGVLSLVDYMIDTACLKWGA